MRQDDEMREVKGVKKSVKIDAMRNLLIFDNLDDAKTARASQTLGLPEGVKRCLVVDVHLTRSYRSWKKCISRSVKRRKA